MTDRELIIDKFIIPNFIIGDTESGSFHVKNKLCNAVLTPYNFFEEITNMYSDFITDEGISVNEMVSQWYDEKISVMFERIYSYLNNKVIIRLGRRNWEPVYKNGDPFFWKLLVKEFKDEFGKNAVKIIYDKWCSDEVYEQSERMMNEPYMGGSGIY